MYLKVDKHLYFCQQKIEIAKNHGGQKVHHQGGED
jgi:hypothetical protein